MTAFWFLEQKKAVSRKTENAEKNRSRESQK